MKSILLVLVAMICFGCSSSKQQESKISSVTLYNVSVAWVSEGYISVTPIGVGYITPEGWAYVDDVPPLQPLVGGNEGFRMYYIAENYYPPQPQPTGPQPKVGISSKFKEGSQ